MGTRRFIYFPVAK